MNSLLFSPRRIALLVAICVHAPATLFARTLIDVGSGVDADAKTATAAGVVSARFQREFDATTLKSDERLVLSVRAIDGAVIYVNGKEIGRLNMPSGPVDAKTLALAPLDEHKSQLFVRVPVPPDAVKPGAKNVIEIDVHSARADAWKPSFALALQTLPADQLMAPPSADAKRVLEMFLKTSYIATGITIPDGYFDGGRHMRLDAQDAATSHREILVVDRGHDPELAKDLEFVRTLRTVPPLDRARQIALYVDKIMSPPGGTALLKPVMDELEHEYANKPLRIGDVCDQFHAGVCRHRSLLFKVLADEAGLKSALVRGTYMHLHAGGGGAHAWNEIQLDDGRRFLVDTTLHPKDPFPEITTPQVTSVEISKRYVKEGGAPFYTAAR